MKRLTYLICLILIATNCQFKSDKNETPETKNIVFAENLSRKLLEAQKNGTYYKLSESDATPMMVSGLTESLQKSSYNNIKNVFGDYKDLNFESMEERTINNETYEIYRFKGQFEHNDNVEIRAVLNKSGKLSGFFVMPWNDQL